MNVGVVLDYFPYFLPFSRNGGKHSYFYTTTRRRFANAPISSPAAALCYYDPTNDTPLPDASPAGDWLHYFRTALALGSLSGKFSARELAARYERHLERFITAHHLDVIISGGNTGFERCALATARRMNIGTLCVWEGFFRPRTITYDRLGMNAESEFSTVPFAQMTAHVPSAQAREAVDALRESPKKPPSSPPALRTIHDHRFDIFHQARNRWMDRYDIERIRLPLRAHLSARLAYGIHRLQYHRIENITRPFILFPLQTHTDSNIVLNCDIQRYREVVTTVLSAYRSARESAGCDLVIKEHPLDVFRASYPVTGQDGVFWVPPETPVASLLLHPQCRGTILVNSTAGLESLALERPVAALGRSIYSRPELVETVQHPDAESVAQALTHLPFCSVHRDNVDAFLHYLYDKAQLPGNLDTMPAEEEMKHFEHFLTERFS